MDRNYGDESYLQGVNAAIGLLETLWQQRGAESRFAGLSDIFTTATRLEGNFWQMGLNAAGQVQCVMAPHSRSRFMPALWHTDYLSRSRL